MLILISYILIFINCFLLQINLNKSEAGADYSPTKISISEIQGDRNFCKFNEEHASNLF